MFHRSQTKLSVKTTVKLSSETYYQPIFKMESNKPVLNSLIDDLSSQLSIENDKLPPKICGLNVDCWHEIFEWLSLKDIHSVGETCTRLQLIAGDYFRTNFKAAQIYINTDCGFRILSVDDCIPSFGFNQFIHHLTIRGHDMVDNRVIGMLNDCKSLKHIFFSGQELNAEQIESIKSILGQLEIIEFVAAKFDGDLYDGLLKFCPNLNRLNIYRSITVDNDWLLRNYPALEHFGLWDSYKTSDNVEQLATFFEQNPQLKSFGCNSNSFFVNIQTIKESKMKFEDLIISIDTDEQFQVNEYELHTLCHELNQLYDQGFYKWLEIQIDFLYSSAIDPIHSVKGLKKLSTTCLTKNLVLDTLTNLIELYCDCRLINVPTAETLAKSLVNLKRLSIDRATPEIIQLFIRYSANLKEIKVKFVECDDIDVPAWNKMRKNLPGARKITLYIDENFYFKTIWTTKMTDFKMIEIKRSHGKKFDKFVFI